MLDQLDVFDKHKFAWEAPPLLGFRGQLGHTFALIQPTANKSAKSIFRGAI